MSKGVSRGQFLTRTAASGLVLAGTSSFPSGPNMEAEAATNPVKIGVDIPLTGSLAAIGAHLKAGAQLAADIVNGSYNSDVLMARSRGLPRLGNAPVQLIFADNQSNSEIGATEAQRLISQEHVAAIIGCYASAITATASEVAERNRVPFLTGLSSDPHLTKRGYRYFFRTCPNEETLVPVIFDFIANTDSSVKSIGILVDNSSLSADIRRLFHEYAAKHHWRVAADIVFPAGAPSLDNELRNIQTANPDVLLALAYSADAVNVRRAMLDVNYTPRKALVADDAGFVDPKFIPTLGKAANYIMTRDLWNTDLLVKHPGWAWVNDKYKAMTGASLNEDPAREIVAVLVMADAINRAGSTNSDAIRTALEHTDIAPQALIMPWKGVKFDADHQNTLTEAIIVQIQNERYRLVWPVADRLVKPIWPWPSQGH